MAPAILKPPAPIRFQPDRLFALFFANRLPPEYIDALLQSFRAGLRQALDLPPGYRMLEAHARIDDPGEAAERKFVRVDRSVATPPSPVSTNQRLF